MDNLKIIEIDFQLNRKVEGDRWQWKETARWVKFEEDVEEVGNYHHEDNDESGRVGIVDDFESPYDDELR